MNNVSHSINTVSNEGYGIQATGYCYHILHEVEDAGRYRLNWPEWVQFRASCSIVGSNTLSNEC